MKNNKTNILNDYIQMFIKDVTNYRQLIIPNINDFGVNAHINQLFEQYGLAHEYGNKALIYIKNETFFMNNKLIPKLIILIPILLIIFASKPQKLFKVKYIHVISLCSFGLIFFLNPFFSGLPNIILNSLGFISLQFLLNPKKS